MNATCRPSLAHALAVVAALTGFGVAAAAAAATPREAWEASVTDGYRNLIGPGNAMAYVEEDPGLPRVLLIGDSISIGYTPTVRKTLAGKANVLRIPDNANNTAHGLEHLVDWLGAGRWDVIHFNWGLHDCFRKVPLEEYTANLEAIVARLEKTGARLVWASSTPIPDGNPWTKKPAGEVAYNAAAAAVMKKHGIPVDDLHAVIAPRFAEFATAPTDVHFKEPGSELLGQEVAAAIVKQLSAAKPIRIGVVGLDAHAKPWLEIIRAARARAAGGDADAATGDIASLDVVAAFPGGSPDIPEKRQPLEDGIACYRQAGVEIVDSVEALLPKVDAVMILSVDGRAHLPQARPVIAAGKPLFIDKPVAASLADAREIFRLAAERSTPVFSSSALRFAPGTQAVLRDAAAGAVLGCDAFSPCKTEPHHPDLFWYGIHGVETLYTLMGPGCERVSRTKTADTDVVVGTWNDGRIGTFRGLRAGKRGYGAMAFCERANLPTGTFEGYEPLIAAIARFFRTGAAPVPPAVTLEIVAFMEAAERSAAEGGRAVPLAPPGPADADKQEPAAGRAGR